MRTKPALDPLVELDSTAAPGGRWQIATSYRTEPDILDPLTTRW